ncbi:MAG: hypothetical protein J7K72_03715 [Candidatus Aenigmarchaeota archaeon]|nr:hypothetical protein [Candidatus Aenigmarchaeota archaeon]
MSREYREEIDVLKLFNEKVDRLHTRSFVEKLKKLGYEIHLKNEFDGKLYGPDDESVEAFVLTIRFFYQNNEKISLSNMSEIYEKLPISPKVKREFERIRNELNTFLDSKTRFTINGKEITNREIFETFLYGDLAHSNKTKRKTYEFWKSNIPLYIVLKHEFIEILSFFIEKLSQIKKLNERILGEAEKWR